jgi:hypothetical protein
MHQSNAAVPSQNSEQQNSEQATLDVTVSCSNIIMHWHAGIERSNYYMQQLMHR